MFLPPSFSYTHINCYHFSAVEEDANRAIELKNGSSVGGRKVAVKQAMPRPPREARQSKSNQGNCCTESGSAYRKTYRHSCNSQLRDT